MGFEPGYPLETIGTPQEAGPLIPSRPLAFGFAEGSVVERGCWPGAQLASGFAEASAVDVKRYGFGMWSVFEIIALPLTA